MNYLKQIVGFKRKRLEKQLSSNAICLYYILLEYANELCFPSFFTAANSQIASLCGFSVSTLERRRRELCDKGYITYTDGINGKCGTYSIVPLKTRVWKKDDAEGDEEVTSLNKHKDIYKCNIYNARAYTPSVPQPRRLFFSYGSDEDEE